VGIAQAVSQVAPILWGHYSAEELQVMRLEFPSISEPKTQSAATR
jgi:hypothetical protein